MNLSEHWHVQFGTNDFLRGEDYYESRLVRNLTEVEGGWTATVIGSAPYHVFVPGAHQDIDLMSCDCPRFANGYNCKHLAAACLAIEHASDEMCGVARDGSVASRSLDELVDSVAEEDLRAFLLGVLRDDELLRTQFVQRFGVVDVEEACRFLASQIEDAVWEYGDGGFVDWRHSSRFQVKFNQVVATSIDPLVERGDLASALELSFEVLRCLQDISIDDSDGFITDTIEDVRRLWKKLAMMGDDSYALHQFDRIEEFLEDSPAVDDGDVFSYEQDMAEEFLIEGFSQSSSCADRVLALCDARLEEEKDLCARYTRERDEVLAKLAGANGMGGKRVRRDSYVHGELKRRLNSCEFYLRGCRQRLGKWTCVKLEVLQVGGATEAELREAAGKQITCDVVTSFFAERALRAGDAEEAARLLQNSKDAYLKDEGTYPVSVSLKLVKVLEGLHSIDLREELLFLIDHSSRRAVPPVGNLWVRLRESYDEGEWQNVHFFTWNGDFRTACRTVAILSKSTTSRCIPAKR